MFLFTWWYDDCRHSILLYVRIITWCLVQSLFQQFYQQKQSQNIEQQKSYILIIRKEKKSSEKKINAITSIFQFYICNFFILEEPLAIKLLSYQITIFTRNSPDRHNTILAICRLWFRFIFCSRYFSFSREFSFS